MGGPPGPIASAAYAHDRHDWSELVSYVLGRRYSRMKLAKALKSKLPTKLATLYPVAPEAVWQAGMAAAIKPT